MKRWVSYTILIILVLLSIIPFASRAVYMDEHMYLHVAKYAIERDWRFPQETPWIFFGTRGENLAAQSHPPLGEYYLALILKIFGHFDETIFRLMFAIFPIIATLGFYRLAKRFTMQPLLVASLFAVSPAFFVLAPTLMMDIPMLAFLLVGLSLYLDGMDTQPARLWPASICFMLAAGTGYTALVPLGCLFIWSVVNGRPKREWLSLITAPLVLLIWLIIMRVHFGEYPAVSVAHYFISRFSFLQNLLPIFSFVGGVGLIPWSFLALSNWPNKRVIAVSSVVAAGILSLFHSWPSLQSHLWFVLLASSGIGWLILFGMKSSQRVWSAQSTARGFLIIWLPMTLLFLVLVADMICARYILLLLPPLFLITLQDIRRKPAVITLAVTMGLAFSIAIADYRFVASYRDWVVQTVVPLQQQGFRFWNATESGLRYYLEQNGIPTLDSSDIRPKGGDLIVRQTSFRYSLSNDLAPLLVTIKQEDLRDPYPIRTFNAAVGAGFHDSNFGFVPFSFSNVPLDRLEVAQVSLFVKELPQVVPPDFSSVPVWFPGGVLLKQVQPEMRFCIPLPRDAKLEYELEGEGTVEISNDCIILRKLNSSPAIWKNFRIVPSTWKLDK